MNTWENYDINDLPSEEWMPIENCDGYMVSNLSRVKSLDRVIETRKGVFCSIKGRVLKQMLNDKGYLCVSIKNKNVYPFQRVHVLVAKAFIPNPDNKPQVSHLDHNRANPSIGNLQWATGEENLQQSVRDLRMQHGEDRYCSKLTTEEVRYIIGLNMPYREIAKKFNVNYSTIQKIKSGKIWKHVTLQT